MNYTLDCNDYNYIESNEYGSNNDDINYIDDSFINEPDYNSIYYHNLFSLEKGNIELLDNNDENFNNQLQTPCIKNNLEKNLTYCGNQKTKMTSKKTKRSNILNVENKLNMGRKPKNALEKGHHTKYSEDNIMRKIKAKYLKYILNLINKSIKNNKLKLFKFDSEISENLKKDFNMILMNTTFRQLYENRPLSSRYKRKAIDNRYLNKDKIKKIYSEYKDKEIDAINILNMTYKELFNHFLKNNLDNFLNEVYEKEKENNELEEDIVNYLEKIKMLCYKYEDWLKNKKGRNIIKKSIGNKKC